MHGTGNRVGRRLTGLWLLCLLLVLGGASQALAAEEPPYEFSAELSLTGGCTTSKGDPIPDPGCPETKPPKTFTSPRSIAIDSFGDEYVASYGAEEGKQGRIDVFSPKGVFITEIKDEFGPKSLAVDSKGNVYAFDFRPEVGNVEIARYSPSLYKPAEGKLEWTGSRSVLETFSAPSVGGVAVDAATGNVFVAHSIKIDKYSSAEEGNKLLETITDEKLKSTTFVAVDAQRRRLYASSCPTGDITKCWVLVFNVDKPSELLKEVKGPNTIEEGFAFVKGWISIAVDEENGDFFVGDLEQSKNVYQFNAKYELVSTLALNPELFEGGEPMQIALSNAPEGTKNRTYLFVPSLKSRALAFSPPQEQPAKVKSISVAGIGEEEAELLATIEPRGGETTYVFEYLSQQEYEEAGNSFEGAKVAGEGTILPAEQEAEVTAPIGSLSPETEYRVRVSAENKVGGEAKEATFTTYNDAPVSSACENQPLRLAYSTLLPDCRAYELVTPADTNGRPPQGIGPVGDQFTTVEASPSGNAVSFITLGGVIPGLGGTGSFLGDLYRTTRTAGGWSTESAGPNGEETLSANEGSTSPDQGYSFWTATRGGSAVIEGEDTHYVRYPDGHSELVGRGSLGTDPKAHGTLIAEGGTHIAFQTQGINGKQPIQLEENAPPTGTRAVYDRTADEVTHVVSLLPGNETPKPGENADYLGASPDGEGIAFLIGKKLYLRVNDATTYEIGEGVEFAGVAEGGSRIFYLEGGDLFAFDVATEKAIRFTEVGNAVPVNVSPDGTRAYFVSTTVIGGSGENPNGASAQAGEENLYLSEAGTIRFVATVTGRDVVGGKDLNGSIVDGLGLWVTKLKEEGRIAEDPSRANPDGTVLLFQSRANLDGYDPEGAPEVYRYDSAGNRLHCISCIPTRTPAAGGASLESYDPGPEGAIGPFASTGFVPNLRADGKRAIFQSTEALVSRDNDGVQDVYEWEEQGVGSCARAGGCVYLVSSGHSDKPNYLYGINASGNDVFFITGDILAGGDNNTLSIYDARVNGGFPESTPIPCQETDKCRGAASPPPSFPFPTSEGLGQLGETPGVKCPKGKHKVVRDGQEVCAKNKKKQKNHHRKHNKTKKGAGK
jgi:hypothetical protein